MKIAFVPIDNRPVCYNLAKDIISTDEDLEFFIPPREYLGGLQKSADTEALFDWIKNLPETDCMILSLDTLAYGGLIPSAGRYLIMRRGYLAPRRSEVG